MSIPHCSKIQIILSVSVFSWDLGLRSKGYLSFISVERMNEMGVEPSIFFSCKPRAMRMFLYQLLV